MSKRYEVVGTQPILDHQPGETFTASLDPEQERFLLAIGGLRVKEDKPKKSDADRRRD